MIWDDPWIAAATDQGGSGFGPWCTLLPPPVPALPDDCEFRCTLWTDVSATEWVDLVGTRWDPESLAARLTDAWIPQLYRDGDLVATCVLRQRKGTCSRWILETLKARRGNGTLLMRCLMTWIYRRSGPFILAYTWELAGAQLAVAWWRGWLASAAAVQYGWVWRTLDGSGCNFCPKAEPWTPIGPRLVAPTLFRQQGGAAVVSDSGLGDGWGYVAKHVGVVDWAAVCARGGWRALWMRGATAPKDWRWSGEFVVVGLLNHFGPVSPASLDWVSAEVASA
jgi:hypothetical protein